MSATLRYLPFAAAVAAMIATPLFPRGGDERALLATAVIGAWCGHAVVAVSRRWGVNRSLGALGAVAVVTLLVEVVGSRTGVPFGHYEYTGRLRPAVLDVPAIVPLAWFAVGTFAREVAVAVTTGRLGRIVVGALALTAWDLFLDPQMVGEGYWRWMEPGAYRGIPLGNYVGWVITGLVVMVVLEFVIPPLTRADVPSLAAYATIAVMQTVGFAVFFGDPLVAIVGGLGMLPLTILAIRRTGSIGAHRGIA